MAVPRSSLGVLAAIAVTTAMDAGGLSDWSALALAPLFALFWWLGRHSRREIGFARGAARDCALALGYPLLVIGALVAIAAAAGQVDTAATDWNKALLNLALMFTATTLLATVTEEGFFRGWLFAALAREGRSRRYALVMSSVSFMLWHVPAVTIAARFRLPPEQMPVYLANALLIGLVWGLLRTRSGSVLVSSLSHGLWNALAYVLFGFGSTTGALGVAATGVYGPEAGYLGVALNGIAAAVLWRRMPAERADEADARASR